MDEILKGIMGDSYQEGMTAEGVNEFFKNQVLGSGEYVNKGNHEAALKKVQSELKVAKDSLKGKSTAEELSQQEKEGLEQRIKELNDELLQGKITTNRASAEGKLAKAKALLGDNVKDVEFSKFIQNISTEDQVKTGEVSGYVASLLEKAYEKGKSDAGKNSLGQMGKITVGSDEKVTADVQFAKNLAESQKTTTNTSSYFK